MSTVFVASFKLKAGLHFVYTKIRWSRKICYGFSGIIRGCGNYCYYGAHST